jgi:electron transfer flavoprotein alpha/beta subunit
VDASNERLRVKRELESGWYQWYSMPTPALLTIQSGISQIRYATLKGIMAAKKKEIKEVTPSTEIVERPTSQLTTPSTRRFGSILFRLLPSM